MLKFLQYILQLIISPKNGWCDIAKSNCDQKLLMTTGFYPLLGLASISAFAGIIFDADITLVRALQNAIVIFISYFITYFLAELLFSTFLGPLMNYSNETSQEPTSVRYVSDNRLYTTFIIYNLSILVLITFIRNLLPIELSLVQFLPFCVAFIMWKGTEYMSVPEKKTGQFMFLSVFSILMPIYIFQYLFQLIIG